MGERYYYLNSDEPRVFFHQNWGGHYAQTQKIYKLKQVQKVKGTQNKWYHLNLYLSYDPAKQSELNLES